MNTGAGRKLGRPTGHRFQMLRNMAASLLHYEKIEYQPKPKRVKPHGWSTASLRSPRSMT